MQKYANIKKKKKKNAYVNRIDGFNVLFKL